MQDDSKLSVYYNSACPVCNAGIKYQKDKMQDCPVVWNDVHSDNALVNDVDADLEFVRERLHAKDSHGNIHVGFDAFLTIWRHSPGEQWKARLFGLPLVRHLGRVAYNLFAALLYKWNRAKKHW